MTIETIIDEINITMKDVKKDVKDERYRGLVRNHYVEQITTYLNNIQNKYVFQTGFDIQYHSVPVKRRLGYEAIVEKE